MSQGSLNPKIRFLGQKVCYVARAWTDSRGWVYTDCFKMPPSSYVFKSPFSPIYVLMSVRLLMSVPLWRFMIMNSFSNRHKSQARAPGSYTEHLLRKVQVTNSINKITPILKKNVLNALQPMSSDP